VPSRCKHPMMGSALGPGGKFNLCRLNNLLLTNTTNSATATTCTGNILIQN
jgi:hypothetical protein